MFESNLLNRVALDGLTEEVEVVSQRTSTSKWGDTYVEDEVRVEVEAVVDLRSQEIGKDDQEGSVKESSGQAWFCSFVEEVKVGNFVVREDGSRYEIVGVEKYGMGSETVVETDIERV